MEHILSKKEQREAVGLLQLGTLLEYFDLMLFVHMAVLLNELFFPKTDPHTTQLLQAFAFCSTFLLRPLGALLFGYIGDRIGRKATVVITTFMMVFCCFVMATLPTYAQIGIAASWIITLCRISQGLSSMGEVIGAQLYLTESFSPPYQFTVVALIGCFAALGSVAALGIATLATTYEFSWRLAFYTGAGIAVVGSVARNKLRETPEFVDAKREVDNSVREGWKSKEELAYIIPYHEKPIKKTSLAYFLIQCIWPAVFYFAYIHCGSILRGSLGYTVEQCISHSLKLSFMHLFATLVLSFLSSKVYPLHILKWMLGIFLTLILVAPILLNHIQTPSQLLVLQGAIVVLAPYDLVAAPIFFKHFPIFKRFTYTSMLYAISRSLIYVITSVGLVYLSKYFGSWGISLLMLPLVVGYGWGVLYFEKLERAAGNYPTKASTQI
ncbi:MAG TPA: MFS transporter [Amoebophilaceae bacterium]|nr:MFS transporter [Amoebophilaceae bacterium]